MLVMKMNKTLLLLMALKNRLTLLYTTSSMAYLGRMTRGGR